MQPRSVKYFKRFKALKMMQHPEDLRSFLKAEFEASTSIFVKKHIIKIMEEMHPKETGESMKFAQ